MIKKIISKMRKIFLIKKINKIKKCQISWNTSIDKQSYFEGRNVIHKKTTIIRSKVGRATYISNSCNFYKTQIGKYCSIAPHVEVIAGNHPTKKFVSTHPLFYSKNSFAGLSFNHNNNFDEFSYADDKNQLLCSIGNDVWIGHGVKIVNGVSIGDGAIIGAGAIVTKNVPSYSVVGGVPAKVIKYRFEKHEIEYLRELKWWNRSDEWIEEHVGDFSDIKKLMREV